MRTDIEEKVLEKLATSDKATIVIERQPDGKMRVTSGSWDGEKVFLRNQVFEATGRRRKRRSRNRLALVVPKLWFAGNVLTIGDPRWISSGTPMIWRFTEC
jgi:hypothetical protein